MSVIKIGFFIEPCRYEIGSVESRVPKVGITAELGTPEGGKKRFSSLINAINWSLSVLCRYRCGSPCQGLQLTQQKEKMSNFYSISRMA
jgi:hypothetical protein